MTNQNGSEKLSDEELDLYGYVSSSSRRESIVTVLEKSPMTPSQISENTDIRLNHVSNVLSDLSDEEVVKCVNPDRKRGRIYKLTEEGNKVAKKVSEDE